MAFLAERLIRARNEMFAFDLLRVLFPHGMRARIKIAAIGPQPSVYKCVMPNGASKSCNSTNVASARAPKTYATLWPI